MSVLISGINKPTNCKDCIFCVNDWCVINSRLHHIKGAEETTQYCPLVKLPPHEDLIGRNAAIRSAFKGEQNIYCWDEIEEAIDSVPAIVESEE